MNDRVLAKSIEAIQEGLSEVDLAEKVNEFFAAEGAAVKSLCIVAYGKYCAIPHHGPSKEVFLQPGDNVLFDIGKNLDGYYSDMTRTVCYKSATDLQRKIYDLVLEANMAAIAAVKPGVRACDVDAAARNVIAKAGYGEYFTHGLGHSLGLDIHEEPRSETGIGEFDGLGIAHEEDDAQLFFQGLDGTADGGLRNVQRPRRFAE